MNPFFTPIIAFVLCAGLTPVIRRIALKKGWMAQPNRERWHKQPTALLGGIAIYAAIAAALFPLADFGTLGPHFFPPPGPLQPPSFIAVIWVGMSLLFLLGLLDDFLHIKPHTKLVGQILVASLVTFLGFRLHWFTSLTLDTTLTIVWVVGITNAFNLLDNMDGLCAGIGAIAGIYLALLYAAARPEAAGAALGLAGALVAFLVYNFHPASIFMGDCGSLLIGFVLSMLGLYFPATAGNLLSSYAVPVMVLLVPIFDTTMVTAVRLLSGRKASTGGRDHTSHRLVLMGFSERGSVLFLYGTGAVSGLAALFVSRTDSLTSPAVIIPLAVALLLMGIYLAQLRVYPEKEFSSLRGRVYTPIIMELTYKRQLLLVMLDFGLIAFAYYLSYRLRFDSAVFAYYFNVFLRSLPAVIACKFVAFYALGIYRHMWRSLSVSDVLVHLKASFLATLLSVAVVTYIYRFEDFSKGLFVMDWFLTTGLLLGTRGSFRLFSDTLDRRTLTGDAVVIYGAGRGGELLLREVLNNKNHHLKPVGFIDDDTLKTGKKFQGYPVLGTFRDLPSLVAGHRIRGLIISFHGQDPAALATVQEFCRRNDLFLRKFSIHIENVDQAR